MHMVVRGFTSNTMSEVFSLCYDGPSFRPYFYQSPRDRKQDKQDKKKEESGAVYLSQFTYTSYILIFMILYASNHSQKRGVILGRFS